MRELAFAAISKCYVVGRLRRAAGQLNTWPRSFNFTLNMAD